MKAQSEHQASQSESGLIGSHHWISEVVYGKIVITAIIVVLEGDTEQPLHVIEVLVLSVLVLGLARAYVDVLATHIDRGNSMAMKDVLLAIRNILPIFLGLIVPILIFLASQYGLLNLDTAFVAAKFSAILLLFVFGMWLGTAAGKRGLIRIVVALVPTALGVSIIFIKALAH